MVVWRKFPLSERHRLLIELYADGNSRAEVADYLNLTERQVTNIQEDCQAAAEARNVTHLVAVALRKGWIV